MNLRPCILPQERCSVPILHSMGQIQDTDDTIHTEKDIRVF